MQRTVLRRPFCASVRLSVKACIVTKRKKLVPTFLYNMKDRLSWFSDKKNGWWGDPLLPEICAKLALLERKRRFSMDIRS